MRAVHASYSAECFIRAVLGMAWHRCLGPALSSCGVLGTKCCILEEKNVNGERIESADLGQLYILLRLKRTSL